MKDDQQKPEVARQAGSELINEGVVAIIGPVTSVMAVAATPPLNEARMMNLSPTVTTQQLSGHEFWRCNAIKYLHQNCPKSEICGCGLISVMPTTQRRYLSLRSAMTAALPAIIIAFLVWQFLVPQLRNNTGIHQVGRPGLRRSDSGPSVRW
ncbi:MAG: hypothetical protein H6964_10305 [Chromatiaceae bacterium]|nr:hypothetical protein [Gammaproteobacteria bacterium]MCP5447371.1 hypothetical protein [Chromatiaceae bacterium]